MAHCYFKTVLVIGFRRVLGSGRQAQIRESRGRQTSLPGCWPNDIAHILPPTSLNAVSGFVWLKENSYTRSVRGKRVSWNIYFLSSPRIALG